MPLIPRNPVLCSEWSIRERLFIGVCRYRLRGCRATAKAASKLSLFRKAEAGMGSLPAGLFLPPSLLLGGEPNGVLDLDGMPDQATGPLNEGEFVGETALQQYTDAKVPGYIGHRDQRHVLGDPQVHQVVGLDEDKESLCLRVLDFGQLTSAFLDEDLLQASIRWNRFLADELEAAVQRTEDLILKEGARLQSFLDVWILNDPAQFLIDLCGMFGPLTDVAEHFDK